MAAAQQLLSRGVNFTFFNAVDGAQQPLPHADVRAGWAGRDVWLFDGWLAVCTAA